MSQAKVFLPSPPLLPPVPVCPCLSLAKGLPSSLETSRTPPFTLLTSDFAVLARYGRTCGFTRMPLHILLCSPMVHGPAVLWTSGFPRVQDVCPPTCHFTCTEHYCLNRPFCSHYFLVYILFIYPRLRDMV